MNSGLKISNKNVLLLAASRGAVLLVFVGMLRAKEFEMIPNRHDKIYFTRSPTCFLESSDDTQLVVFNEKTVQDFVLFSESPANLLDSKVRIMN